MRETRGVEPVNLTEFVTPFQPLVDEFVGRTAVTD
jgi:hypothetical protein